VPPNYKYILGSALQCSNNMPWPPPRPYEEVAFLFCLPLVRVGWFSFCSVLAFFFFYTASARSALILALATAPPGFVVPGTTTAAQQWLQCHLQPPTDHAHCEPLAENILVSPSCCSEQ